MQRCFIFPVSTVRTRFPAIVFTDFKPGIFSFCFILYRIAWGVMPILLANRPTVICSVIKIFFVKCKEIFLQLTKYLYFYHMERIITHYIYALYHNGNPFYIGASVNPAKRLYDHFGSNSFPKVYEYMKGVKNISDISIVILEKYNTKKIAKYSKRAEKEQRWILKYLAQGHTLINTVIAHKKYSLKSV